MEELTKKIAEEIAKQLPVREVYEEGASPALREAGQLLGDLMKTVRLMTAPIQYFALQQDRFRKFLEEAVGRVPAQRLVQPVPQILGPVVEGIKYETEGSSISEMYSQLLSKAMDKDKVEHAHPAFAQIIRQLSSDEAQILDVLKDGDKTRSVSMHFNSDATVVIEESVNVETDEFPHDRLIFPDNLFTDMLHLEALGLAELSKPSKDSTTIDLSHNRAVTEQVYRLLPWGKRFVDACSETSNPASTPAASL